MTLSPCRLIAVSALVFALSACNSDSSSSNNSSSAPQGTTETSVTDSSPSLTDSSNEFRDAFCPDDSALPEQDQDIAACENESQESVDAERASVLARFCPVTAEGFPLADFSLPGEAPEIGVVGEDFPLLCRDEADQLFNALAPVMDGLSPLAEQICPATNAAGNSNPQDCFAEAISGLSGQLPEGGSGGADGLPGLEDIPLLGDLLAGSDLPGLDTLPVVSDLLDPALLPEFGAAPEFGDGPSGLPDFPGAGEFPGAEALAGQICERTAARGHFSQETPFRCLAEAERNLLSASKLIIVSNPLSQAVCPTASIAPTVDPGACVNEITDQFVPREVTDLNPLPRMSGFAGLPSIGNLTDLTLTILKSNDLDGESMLGFFEACASDSDPLTCLLAVGDRFDQIQPLMEGENPVATALCPGQEQDPAACFSHTLEALAAMAPDGQPMAFDGIPGIDRLRDLTDSDADLPGAGSLPLLAEFCSADSDPFSCLLAAGDSLEALTGLLEGGMATENFCPESGSADPAACFSEFLASLPELSEGELPEAGNLLKMLTELSL